MNQQTLRCAVVGVGYLGRLHAQKYAALEQASLVGVCDLNEEQGKQVGDELGVKWFSDYRKLKDQVDAVTIASTTPSHYEIAKFFLQNGIHTHIEKPMTSTYSEGEKLCQLAKDKSLKLQVGHIERFNPAFVAVREKLNNPVFIECHRMASFKPRNLDVSVVLDLMIHDLDMILFLVNHKPVNISAIGTPILTDQTDIASARVEFESGTLANITVSRVSQTEERKFRVFQKDQYLSLDLGRGEVRLLTKIGEWVRGQPPLDQKIWKFEKEDALMAETSAFVNSIQNDQPCVVPGEDGLLALQLAEQIEANIYERLRKIEAQ